MNWRTTNMPMRFGGIQHAKMALIIVEFILGGLMHGTSSNPGCRKGNTRAAKFDCDDFRIQMLRSKDTVRNAAIIKLPTCLKCGSIGIDMAKDFAKW